MNIVAITKKKNTIGTNIMDLLRYRNLVANLIRLIMNLILVKFMHTLNRAYNANNANVAEIPKMYQFIWKFYYYSYNSGNFKYCSGSSIK